MSGGRILYREERGIAWIILNRPEVQNSIAPSQLDDLVGLLADAGASVAVRAVVLTGAGDHFCSGADLRSSGEFASPPRPDGAPERTVGEIAHMMRIGWQRLVTAVMDCEKPVIAGVRGNVAGGGVPLALSCDLVVAAAGTRLICVWARRGLVPDAGAAYLLPRIVGLHRAKELVLLGEPVDAARAERLGLVNRVVADEELEANLHEVGSQLAEGPTKALSFSKLLLNHSLDAHRAASMEEEALYQELVAGSDDMRSAAIAFANREPTVRFRGW
jgi:2-(1,2-epoxy-1,2-dihydrophenyl)acetyl-CoA isomerase